MNRRRGLAWLLFGTCVLAPTRTRAAEVVAASPLDERISIELVEADPGDALRSFSQLTGMQFVVDPALHTPFTATLRNVRVRTGLDVLCESVGCTWREVPGSPTSVRVTGLPDATSSEPPPPVAEALSQKISLQLKAAAAKDVFASFQVILGGELELAPEVAGEITVHLEAVPVRAALDAVCAQLGCSWGVDTSAPKPVLRVRKMS